DGLAGGVTLTYLISFLIIFFIISNTLWQSQFLIKSEYKNLIILVASAIGGVLGYLLFNSHPALIFMGDTGSLALGGLLGAISLFTKTVLYVPFLGIMFVVSSLSVIIQVLHYKRTHKRVFLMAPFHHHLEQKSMYETKIVVIYMVITAIVGLISILLTLLFT
ncbi:MAG: phospho-N-acetylmuramoyl-pentapeptide-transferase, partial [Clostridia bacterium]|nr:phospho-N-acetylmuramoyl-pentapeptide-transferase [Clostridia bacterium]